MLERLSKKEPLEPIRPWTKLCKIHSWKGVTLIHPSEYDAYLKNPEAFKETLYCEKCGYVPSLQKVMRENYRIFLKEKEAEAKAAKQRFQDVQEAKEEFFAAATATIIEPERLRFMREGFDVYDRFIDVLPELVKQKELVRVLKQVGLEKIEPAPDNVTYLNKNQIN